MTFGVCVCVCVCVCVFVFWCDVCMHSGMHDGGMGNRDHMINR